MHRFWKYDYSYIKNENTDVFFKTSVLSNILGDLIIIQRNSRRNHRYGLHWGY